MLMVFACVRSVLPDAVEPSVVPTVATSATPAPASASALLMPLASRRPVVYPAPPPGYTCSRGGDDTDRGRPGAILCARAPPPPKARAAMIAAAVAAVALTRGPVVESVTQRSAVVSFR